MLPYKRLFNSPIAQNGSNFINFFSSRGFSSNFFPLQSEQAGIHKKDDSLSSVNSQLYKFHDSQEENAEAYIPKPMDYTQFFKPGYKRPTIRQVKLIEREEFIRNENIDINDISLSTLKRIPYTRKVKIRVGRGQGGRRGKFAGRGLNGQKSRAGVHIPLLFEGGQLKLSKRAPKFGFSNKRFERRYQRVSLEKLQFFIDTGRINPSEGRITMKTLLDSGLVRRIKYPGLKLVANGGLDVFRSEIDIEIPRASKKAIDAIERVGGKITSVYYDKNTIRAMIQGPEKYLKKHYNLPKRAIPPPDLYRYYMRKDVRGYLSDESLMLEERSTPSAEKATTKKDLQAKLKLLLELKRKKSKVKKF